MAVRAGHDHPPGGGHGGARSGDGRRIRSRGADHGVVAAARRPLRRLLLRPRRALSLTALVRPLLAGAVVWPRVSARAVPWLAVIGLLAIALLVRLWAAGLVVFPANEGSAYYTGVARNLVEGRGLVTDAMWSYATPPLVFPRPAFELWLPMTSLLAAIPMALLGTTFVAAQLSSVA